jgi:hypothetical protein
VKVCGALAQASFSGRGRIEPGDADTLPIFHALAMIGKGDLPQA